MAVSKQFKIKCYGKGAEEVSGTLSCGTEYSLQHVKGDHLSVYRFYLTGENFSLELTPSKGLSVRDFTCLGRQVFWNAPLGYLPDPSEIDMEKSMIINGEVVKGTRWLEYFSSHVEMLGLDNWGVPVEKNGRIMGLHGNVSSVPVTELVLEEKDDKIVITGSFSIHDPNEVLLEDEKSIKYFKVEKSIEFYIKKPILLIKDRITNISGTPRFPDWGYHVQLRPEAGCRYLIPSKKVKERGKGIPENGFEFWKKATIPNIREERGVLHKNLLISDNAFPDGSRGVETLLHYSDGAGLKCIIPPSPYTMSWFSCGGKDGTEFMIPGENGNADRKLLSKNWDGVGPEIGASALDHDGDTDPAIIQSEIKPDESVELQIYLELLEQDSTQKLLIQIEDFNKERGN